MNSTKSRPGRNLNAASTLPATPGTPSTQVVVVPRVLDSLQLDKQLKCRLFNEQELQQSQNLEPASEWSDAFAFPSPEELRAFAKAAYDKKSTGDLGDWKLVMTAQSSVFKGTLESFFAKVYLKPKGNQLIVAIKGSAARTPGDVIADLKNVFLNKGGLQVDSVFTFGEELRKLIAKFKCKPQVIITGHSLGGFLAQVLTFTLRNCGIDTKGCVFELLREDFGLNTFVFDSPAAFEQIRRIAKIDPLKASCVNLPIINFIIKQNWINCNSQVGPHVGTVISLSAEEDLKTSTKWKISNISEKHGLKYFKNSNLEEAYQVTHLGSAVLVQYDAKKIPLAQFSQLEQNALRDYQLLIQFPSELKNRLPKFNVLGHQVCVDRVEDAVHFIPRVRFFVLQNRKIIEDLDERFQLQFFSAMSDLWKAHYKEFRDVDLKLKQERVDQILSMESGSSITGPDDEREQTLVAKILSNSAEKIHFVKFDDFKRQDDKNIENWLLNYSGILMLCNANEPKIELKDEYKTKILYLNSVKKDEQQTSSDISIKVSDLEEESRKRLRARKLDFRGNEVQAEKIFHTLFDELRVIEIIDFKCEQEKVDNEFYFEPKLLHKRSLVSLFQPKKNESSTSSERAKKIQESKSQTFLMSCDAGMGKTTNLKKIASELQKSLPTHWVVRLELQSCSESLQRLESTLSTYTQSSRSNSFSSNTFFQTSNTKSALQTNGQKKSFDAAISLVADETLKGVEKPKAKLLREVFYEKIKQKEVIFVLDAVDEVCPLHRDAVLELLQQLKETGLKMLVATRPLHEKDMVQALGTKREDIIRQSLIKDRYHQADFISQLWSSTDSNNLNTAKKLLWALEKTLPDMVPGVPLNLKMIAQSFPEGKLTEEFEKHKDLYKLLFDRGIGGTTQEKFGFNESNAIQQNIKKTFQTKHYTLLQRVAVEAWFDGKITFEFLREEKVDFNRFNFAVVNEGNVRFTHQTFQEYLIAVQLVHFLNNKKDPKIEVFIKREQSEKVIKDENCGKILAFADTILSHTNGFELVSSMAEFFDEKIAVDCLKKNHFNIFRLCKVDDSFYNTPAGKEQKVALELILINGNPKKEFVEYLLEKGARLTDVLNKHHCTHVLDALIQVGQNELIAEMWSAFEPALRIFDYNPLVTAAKFQNFDAARFFIEKKSVDANRAGKKFITCVDDYLSGNQKYLTPLSATIRNDDRKLVQLLIENGARVDLNYFLDGREKCIEVLYHRIKSHATTDVIGRTLLMRAAAEGTPDCVRFLLDEGFDPYEKDLRGQTCLHYIAKRTSDTRSDDFAERCQIFFNRDENAKSTLLFEAVKEGHVEMFSLLLQNNVDLKTVDGDGNTLLHVAAKFNSFFVQLVLEENIDKYDLEARNKFGQTPLYVAAVGDQSIDFVEMLLRKGADPNAKDAKGMIPLHHAAASGHGYNCRALLERVEVDSMDNEGMTPPMLAVKNNNPGAVKSLLEKVADVDLKDKKGWNCLHHAAANGRDECITILRRRNVPLASKTNEGKTAFQLAVENKFKLMADLLLRDEVKEEEYCNARKSLLTAIEENRFGDWKIHLETGNKVGGEEFVAAAERGHLKLLKLFVPHVESIDVKNKNGNTALMKAANENHVECVRFLLENGADQNEKDSNGKTCLDWAAWGGAVDSFYLLFAKVDAKNRNLEELLHVTAEKCTVKELEFLLKEGAKLDSIDLYNSTCLLNAAKNKNPECLKFLLQNHILEFDVNARNVFKQTVLHYVATNVGVAHLQLLVQNGADAAARDEDGQTALHEAAFNGRVENCEFLLDRIPISINSRDNYGRTPLMLAAASDEEGAPSVIKFLLQKGADPNLQNEDGWNCLHHAAWCGRLENVKLLCELVPLEAKDNDGKTALQLAEREKHTEVADFLRAKIEQRLLATHGTTIEANEFTIAAENGDLDQLKAFLPLVKSVDVNNDNGSTALMWAAQKNHVECVKFLIENGANPNEKDKDGFTCLDWAAWGGAAECFEILFDLVAEEKKNLDRLLQFTAEKGKLRTLQFLLEKGANLDSVDHDDDTCLHLAAGNENPECIEYLIREYLDRFDVNARNKKYKTPLHHAAERGRIAHLQLLVQNGADAAARDEFGHIALHMAARYGRAEKCQILLNCIPISINSRDTAGETPLMWAAGSAKEGAPSVIKFLLKKGADPNLQDKDGRNCLHHAAWCGRFENFNVLFDRVPIDATTKRGETALQLAEMQNHSEVAAFLRAKIEQLLVATHRTWIVASEFTIAAERGDLDQLKTFLPLVESVDVKDKNGRTALMCAAWKNHVACVQFLIENGANPNEKDKYGDTSLDSAAWGGASECFDILFDLVAEENRNLDRLLHLTAQEGKLQTLQFLLEKGANLDSVDHDDDTCLHLAAGNENPECIEFLIREYLDRFDVNARNKYNKTPLHYAAWKGGVTHLQLLVQNGADATAKDEKGQTALHVAADSGRTDICEFLLQYIPIDSKDKVGRTPLMVAAASVEDGAPSVIEFLLQKGADPTLQNEWGWNCLQFAAYEGRSENSKVLCDRAPTEAETKNNNK